jgi:hypothetical protein
MAHRHLLHATAEHAAAFLDSLAERPIFPRATPEELRAAVGGLNQMLFRFGDDALSGTTFRGARAMRISVSNWQTSDNDVERSARAILRAAA